MDARDSNVILLAETLKNNFSETTSQLNCYIAEMVFRWFSTKYVSLLHIRFSRWTPQPNSLTLYPMAN